MDPKDDPTGEREFLHDLSNIVAIAQGNLHLLMRKIQKNPAEVKIEDLMPKLESSVNAITRLVDQLNARREKVRTAAAAGTKAAS
jgi:hypothetical protein